MKTLFTRDTTAIIYGRKSVSIQRMLDFDYICGRKPSVSAIIDPTSNTPEKVFYGATEFLIPVYRDLHEAKNNHKETDVLVNFASLRSAGMVVENGIDLNMKVIATIAEGIPERNSRTWIAKANVSSFSFPDEKSHNDGRAKENGITLIGPSTVGAITAGAFRIGDTGGSTDHLIASRLYRPGSVGYVGKSGGMSNEMYRIIANHADGICEGVAIGGDRYPGSHLLDHILRYEDNPDIKIIVVLSEIGGLEEEDIANMLKTGRIKKPLVAWVSGTSADFFPKDVQFGHAGAFAMSKAETAKAKNMILKKAGAHVPSCFEGLGLEIEKIFKEMTLKGIITKMSEEPSIPTIPENRKHTHFQCTISSDHEEEALYGDVPITDFIRSAALLPVIAKLWWKTDLPQKTLTYLEMILCAIADHGPAVAGAHNAIVAATAGKDAIGSLCSGLLTIGPRFGGAIDDAAKVFYDAHSRGLTPEEFVKEMKDKGTRIPGIGHKIKSLQNPDNRVKALLEYAQKNFNDLPITSFALDVERITASKKPNLILNVDGTIAVTLIDALLPDLPTDIRKDFFEIGYLNGLFALGRSIGILGHIYDQKRLKSPLYRHPREDILYGEGVLS